MPAGIQVHLLEEGAEPHICAQQEANAAHPSTASSILNIIPGGFFSFLLSCRKESIKGHSVSPHGLDEARVGLENNNSPV